MVRGWLWDPCWVWGIIISHDFTSCLFTFDLLHGPHSGASGLVRLVIHLCWLISSGSQRLGRKNQESGEAEGFHRAGVPASLFGT